jgi:hypothetical protein
VRFRFPSITCLRNEGEFMPTLFAKKRWEKQREFCLRSS